MALRFLKRGEKLHLQESNVHRGWVDVPMIEEEKPREPKEYWLISGRYFESKDDAYMWLQSEGWKMPKEYKLIHVREINDRE